METKRESKETLIRMINQNIAKLEEAAKNIIQSLEVAGQNISKLKELSSNFLFDKKEYEDLDKKAKNLHSSLLNHIKTISNYKAVKYEESSSLAIESAIIGTNGLSLVMNSLKSNIEQLEGNTSNLANPIEANLILIRQSQIKESQEWVKEKIEHCEKQQKFIQDITLYKSIQNKIDHLIEKHIKNDNTEKLCQANIENKTFNDLEKLFHELKFLAKTIDSVYKKIDKKIALIEVKSSFFDNENQNNKNSNTSAILIAQLKKIPPKTLNQEFPALKDSKHYDKSKDTIAMKKEKKEAQKISFKFYEAPNKETIVRALDSEIAKDEAKSVAKELTVSAQNSEALKNKLSNPAPVEKDVQDDMESLDNVAKNWGFGNN